jgi:tetratricopeptide (TPR) repeat protein
MLARVRRTSLRLRFAAGAAACSTLILTLDGPARTNIGHVLEAETFVGLSGRLQLDAGRAITLLVATNREAEVILPRERLMAGRALSWWSAGGAGNAAGAERAARLRVVAGDLSGALRLLTAVPPAERRPTGHVLAGVVAARLGRDAEARRCFDDSGDAGAVHYADVAAWQLEHGDVAGASRSLSRSADLARSPRARFDANVRLGAHLMYTANAPGESLEAFARAEAEVSAIRDESADVHGLRVMRAHALLNLNRPEDALPVARGAVATGASDPAARTLLGRALLDAGNPAGAVPEFEASIRLAGEARTPASGYAWWGLAQARQALGDAGGARRAMREALESHDIDAALRTHLVQQLAVSGIR